MQMCTCYGHFGYATAGLRVLFGCRKTVSRSKICNTYYNAQLCGYTWFQHVSGLNNLCVLINDRADARVICKEIIVGIPNTSFVYRKCAEVAAYH